MAGVIIRAAQKLKDLCQGVEITMSQAQLPQLFGKPNTQIVSTSNGNSSKSEHNGAI